MPRLTHEQTADVIAQYEDGMTMRAIAEKFSITKMAVSKLLRRNAVATRPVGRPSTLKAALSAAPVGLSPSYLPPVIGVFHNLAIVSVNPREWNIHTIMGRFDQTHAQAAQWMLHLQRHLVLSGYKYLILWEDEVHSPPVTNMVRHKARKQTRKVYARKCSIVEVDRSTSNEFYRKHHIQGTCTGTVHYGLENENELVACMSFNQGSACRGKREDHLLQRYATACQVTGGASKLLAAFRSDHSGPIVSYSDERYAAGGNLYQILGFSQVHVHKPDYRYWRDGTWYPKNAKQRRHLYAEAADRGAPFPEGSKEFNMAEALGYLRCYDMGKITWRLE